MTEISIRKNPHGRRRGIHKHANPCGRNLVKTLITLISIRKWPPLRPVPRSNVSWCPQSCAQCRAAARECTRLSDALRDARDQLELMEFRLLELEDAAPDKVRNRFTSPRTSRDRDGTGIPSVLWTVLCAGSD